MSDALSPQVEQVINDALSLGAYPSRKALLEAAVLEMRAAQGDLAARLELCDQAIDEYESGYRAEWNPDELKRRLREAYPDDSTRKPA
ncbi:MAG: hypothetical protein K8U03_21270 [Planctomycetia bacterium]|nr:hypothetical protein [Planctomycetia bacterium]